LNGYTRKKLYRVLSEGNGEACKECGKLPNQGQLVIDHKDNNNRNNGLTNLQLLCRSCNYKKNPRKLPLDQCVSVSESVMDGYVSEIDLNRRKEPLFREFVNQFVSEIKEVPQNEIVYSGAEEVEISPVTARRYLDKMCSGRGIFEKVNRVKTIMIRFKSLTQGN